MNNITIVFLIFLIFNNSILGQCDWTKIKKNNDNTYTYSESLHLCVGQLVQINKTQSQQLVDLTKAISLKDLSLQDSDKRAQLWSDTSSKLEDRLQKIDKLQKENEWWFFAGGVLVTVAAAYTTSKVLGH